MQTILLDQLYKQLQRTRTTVVVGAGVTAATAPTAEVATWVGLLENGARYCQEVVLGLPDGWHDHIMWQIHSGDLEELLLAAENVTRRLGRPGGHFRHWLDAAFDDLAPSDPRVILAISRLGDLIATTNYDSLLEKVTKRPTIIWRDKRSIDMLRDTDVSAVMHLHGYYSDPESVVLGLRSYDDILRDRPAQFFQQAMAATSTFLFVGFGDGTRDPNFTALRGYMAELFDATGYGHFQLCREDELDRRAGDGRARDPVNLISYGSSYDDLAPFLEDLAAHKHGSSLASVSGEVRMGRQEGASLPVRRDTLIGRANDVKRVTSALQRASLVTITAMRGTGRSRTAIEVARQWALKRNDSVVYVDYGTSAPSSHGAQLLAAALHIAQSPQQPIEQQLAYALHGQKLLVVLDHCEQRHSDAQSLVELVLAASPGICVMATDVHPFELPDERIYTLDPLAVPKPDDDVAMVRRSPAAQLLQHRIQQTLPDFKITPTNRDAVIRLCRALDGLPLALEMAARRVRMRGLPKTAKDVHAWVSSGLDDVLRWSYDALSGTEQRLLRRLSVFAGTFSRDDIELDDPQFDAEHVDTDLSGLVDAGLLTVLDQETDTQFRLLEVIRSYATRQLDESETKHLGALHLSYFRGLAARADAGLTSAERESWLAKVDACYADMTAALTRALCDDPVAALEMVSHLRWYWNFSGLLSEGIAQLDAAPEPGRGTATYARAKHCEGMLAFLMGRSERAVGCLEESADTWLVLGDPDEEAFARLLLGHALLYSNLPDEALTQSQSAVERFRETGNSWGLALALNDLGVVRMGRGETQQAGVSLGEARTMWEKLPDAWGLALTLDNLAKLNCRNDVLDSALESVESAIKVQCASRDKAGHALSLQVLADIRLAQGDLREAAENYVESAAENQRLGRAQLVADCLVGLGIIAGRVQRSQDAALLFGASDALRRSHGVARSPASQERYLRDRDVARGTMTHEAFVELEEQGRGYTPDGVLTRVGVIIPEAVGDTTAATTPFQATPQVARPVPTRRSP